MKRLASVVRRAFHESETREYRVVQTTIWGLIVLSIVLLFVEASLPEGSALESSVRIADRVLLTIFAVEILLRVGSYRPPSHQIFRRRAIGHLQNHFTARLRFVLRPMMLVDILAVLALFPELRGLRALRMLRLLRTVRVFRYRNPFAIVLHALEENELLFHFAFSVLLSATVMGGVSMYLVEVKSNPAIQTLGDGIWWALVTITTVGYGDITPVTLLGQIIAAFVMIAGMFTLALFAGIVGSSLVRGMLSIREEQFRMSDYVNHVVVCGHDESTDLLLDALRAELDLSEARFVIMDNHERPRELSPDFLWVQGDPTKESELDKVRLTHAAAVVVSGERDVAPQIADARTILIVFTIRAYLKKRATEVKARVDPLYVVAEVLDAENVGHTRSAGADEVIETRRIGYSMIAHAIAHHGTAAMMSRVLMGASQKIFIGKIPEPAKKGMVFADLLRLDILAESKALVIGIKAPGGRETLNPPKTEPVQDGSFVIYLADSAILDPP